MKQFKIGKNELNKRLDVFAGIILRGASKSDIYKFIRKKTITVNDKKADINKRLAIDDTVEFWFSDESFIKLSKSNKVNNISLSLDKNRIVYEDDNIIIYNKPRGLLSQNDEKNSDSVNTRLLNYLNINSDCINTFKPSICNRLDRNTSGLIIIGKSLSALRIINLMLKERTINKYYFCAVSGNFDKDGYYDLFLYKDKIKNRSEVFNNKKEGAVNIKTDIRTVYTNNKYSLLSVKLITGKSHQIRAVLSYLNYPIVGDTKYGSKIINGISCHLLHAYKLVFPKIDNELSYLSYKEFLAHTDKIYNSLFGENIWEHGIQEV